MALSIEERDFIVNNYLSSERNLRKIREMFKEEFGYSISHGPIKRVWIENGFELLSPGGNRRVGNKLKYNPRPASRNINLSGKYFDAFAARKI